MDKNDLIKTIERYEKRLEKLGETVQALGWRDEEQQHLRFDILCQIGNLTQARLLDVGCGFGDLFDYFKKRRIHIESYTGIDISDKVLEVARKRHSDLVFLNQNIIESPLNQRFDYVFSSGIFNARINDNYEFLEEMVNTMFQHCNKGIAFNLMTNLVDYEEDYLFYYEPGKVFHLCSKLSKDIVIRHDYPLYEFTVYVYKR